MKKRKLKKRLTKLEGWLDVLEGRTQRHAKFANEHRQDIDLLIDGLKQVRDENDKKFVTLECVKEDFEDAAPERIADVLEIVNQLKAVVKTMDVQNKAEHRDIVRKLAIMTDAFEDAMSKTTKGASHE